MNEILYQMKETSNNTSFDSDNSDNSFGELGNNIHNEEKEEIQIKKKEFNLIYNNIISNQPKKKNFTFKKEEDNNNNYTKLKFPNARHKIYKELFFTKGRTIKELIFRVGLNSSNKNMEINENNHLIDIKNYFLKSKEKFYFNLKQKSKSLIKSKTQSLEQNKVNILNLKKSSSLACFDKNREIKENKYSFFKNDDKESKINNEKMFSIMRKKKDERIEIDKINKETNQTIFINEIEKYLYNRTTTIHKMKLDKINKIGDLYKMESYFNNLNLENILLHDYEFQNKKLNFREFLADLTFK